MRVTVAFAALIVVSACGVQSGSRPDDFDTTRTVSLSGYVATVLLHHSGQTYVLIDVPTTAGTAERWAVQGRPFAELEWTPRHLPLRPGASVMVVAYPAKRAVDLVAIVPADDERLAEITKAGRVVHGIEFTLRDGSTLPFGGSIRRD